MRQYERGGDGRFHDGLLMDLLRDELHPERIARVSAETSPRNCARRFRGNARPVSARPLTRA